MYQPTTRLLTVLELLQARGTISGPELAAVLEVDIRSVRRYVLSLQDLGIPVEGTRGPGGGYRLRPGVRMAPLLFTEPEAVATTLGLLALRARGPIVDPAAREGAIAKLERTLPETTRASVEALREVVLDRPPDRTRPEAAIVALAAAAARRAERLHLVYRGHRTDETARDVDPWGVAVTLDHWYLVGWCHLRRDVRQFRLDRVAALTVTGERASSPPTDFDPLAFVTRGIATVPARHVAVVRFEVPYADVVERVPLAYGLLDEVDGGVEGRFPSDDLDAMLRWLVGLALPMRLVGPPELLAAAHDMARRLARVAAGSMAIT
jgi:predicted DNA-binding transcriptional regulator YafY